MTKMQLWKEIRAAKEAQINGILLHCITILKEAKKSFVTTLEAEEILENLENIARIRKELEEK